MARMRLTGEDWYAIERDPYELLPFVLGEVNDIRKVCLIGEGKINALPKGVTGDADECVLARALSNGWKAKVFEEQIELTNESAGIDYEAMRDELVKLGYNAEVVPRDGDEEHETTFFLGIEHTELTARFIEAFDDDVYPDLILSDDV